MTGCYRTGDYLKKDWSEVNEGSIPSFFTVSLMMRL